MSWELQTFFLSKKGSQRSKYGGGVVKKTLRRSNSLFFLSSSYFLVHEGPKSETGRIRFRRVTVSNTELSEFFCPHRVPGRELREFVSAFCLCGQSELTEFFRRTHRVLPQNSLRLSEFSPPKTALSKTVFRPFSYPNQWTIKFPLITVKKDGLHT